MIMSIIAFFPLASKNSIAPKGVVCSRVLFRQQFYLLQCHVQPSLVWAQPYSWAVDHQVYYTWNIIHLGAFLPT